MKALLEPADAPSGTALISRASCAFVVGILLCPAALSFPVQTNGDSSAKAIEVHVGRGYEDVQNQRFQGATREFQAALALNAGWSESDTSSRSATSLYGNFRSLETSSSTCSGRSREIARPFIT